MYLYERQFNHIGHIGENKRLIIRIEGFMVLLHSPYQSLHITQWLFKKKYRETRKKMSASCRSIHS
jgi:hypothetical protein